MPSMDQLQHTPPRTTIFKQLIVNIMLPVVAAMLLLGGINYITTRNLLKTSSNTKNILISNTITQVLRFQDITLSVLEENINAKVGDMSEYIVSYVFKSTQGIEQADLHQLRASLGLDSVLYDFYIINTDGIVVNTTFRPDMGLNFFAFGEEHEQMLRGIFRQGRFVSEKFTIEAATRRMKKYTYQPTLDRRYIVEVGLRSATADDIIGLIKSTLNEISLREPSVVSAELFMNADDPFSLTKDEPLGPEERDFLKQRFQRRDTVQIERRHNGRRLAYQYFFMELGTSELYKGSVVRIVSDRTHELRGQLLRLGGYGLLFMLVLSLISIIVLRKTRQITRPIKLLADSVNRIAEGDLSQRAEVAGNNEITTLSVSFNSMIMQLEELYFVLDRKVKERTDEVVAQKNEIEQQRDMLEEHRKHITDSIHYARRLQTAMLPSRERISSLFPESFILFRPKDIVSGDFYWFSQLNGKHLFAAVDCTGHGVPGAMVSMVGNNLLNYAVNVLHQSDPVDILNTLSDGVDETFRRDDGLVVLDGMDIALCAMDYSSMKLEFSGALNPAVIVRRGELVVLKGDKCPIGARARAHQHRVMAQRTKQELSVERGDMVFLFTDGYPDQFNEHQRKFMMSRFKNLLGAVSDLPAELQRAVLEETLDEWIGSGEQIDDILVMGVRI